MSKDLIVRRAQDADVGAIGGLLAIYAAKQIVLPRSEEDIRYYLKNFTVAELDGELVGCVAVRDFGNDLLEVRSLVVSPDHQSLGIGRKMVETCIAHLRESRPDFRLFALTYREDFFRKLGFEVVSRERFPEKIWSDCAACPKQHCCDETAVLYVVAEGVHVPVGH